MKEEIAKMYAQALYDDLPPNVFADQVLRLFDVSGELPTSCVNDFEKPEYCSQRNNHLCQKCKDW